MSKVASGFMGLFSKAAPAADVTKLKPGAALPHVTLPTTEVRLGKAGGWVEAKDEGLQSGPRRRRRRRRRQRQR